MLPPFSHCLFTVLVAVLPDSVTVKPISPERIQVLLKQLEVPCRAMNDPRPGPADYPTPPRNFRWHQEPLTELCLAGHDVIPALTTYLNDRTKPSHARMHVVLVITGKLWGWFNTPDPRLISLVQTTLRDDNPGVREAVLIALRGLGVNSNRGLRNARFATKSAMSPATLRILLPDIVKATADPDPNVAIMACKTIWNCGEKNIGVSELLAALKRDELSVRAEAIHTLVEVGPDDDLNIMHAIMGQLKHKDHPQLYTAAVNGVGKFGPAAKDAVPQLIEALNVPPDRIPSYNLLDCAVESLGKIGPDAKAAVPHLIAHMNVGDDIKGQHIIKSLERIDPKAAKLAQQILDEKLKQFRKSYDRDDSRGRPDPAVPVPPSVPKDRP